MVLICIILCILFGFNTSSGDHTIYYNWYNETARIGLTRRFELGYSIIAIASQNYRFFRNMMPIVYVLMINFGIRKNKSAIRFLWIQLCVSLGMLIVCLYSFEYYLGVGTSGYEHILMPIIKDNSLVNVIIHR